METIDLVIIGAGPAGLSTALHLLSSHPSWADRMVILEKESHPRNKLCAGGVTQFGLRILQKLGIHLPLPLPQVPINNARIIYNQRTIHVRRKPVFIVYNRAEFDAHLALVTRQRQGIIHENTSVQSIAIGEKGVTLHTSRGLYRAQVIVGADGSRGLSRRLVKKAGGRSRVARLLEVVSPAPNRSPLFTAQYGIFDFSATRSNLQGYVWDFPSHVNGQSHFNRGVYDARLNKKRARAELPALLFNTLKAWGDRAEIPAIDGHPIHLFSPRNRLSAHRLPLVGDAAGVDPLFGEGIGPALGYGQVAAQSIHQAFATGDFSCRDFRPRFFLSPVGKYLMLRWAVARGSYTLSDHLWFMNGLWSFGKALAALYPEGSAIQTYAQVSNFADKR